MDRDMEILDEVAREKSPPSLRLYQWSPPAVSLGHFQKAEDVVNFEACRRFGVDVVRRPTGGRALLHYREITYCLVVPENHHFISRSVIESYRFLSRGLLQAMENLGLKPMLAPEKTKNKALAPGSCYDTPSAFELQVGEKKLVGSAQLRQRGVLLQHGSVLLELAPELNREVLLVPEQDSGSLDDSFLRERAAGLWDLGVEAGVEKIMKEVQEGFASLFSARFK